MLSEPQALTTQPEAASLIGSYHSAGGNFTDQQAGRVVKAGGFDSAPRFDSAAGCDWIGGL